VSITRRNNKKVLLTATQSFSISPGLVATAAIALKNQQSPSLPNRAIAFVKMSFSKSGRNITLYNIIVPGSFNEKLRFFEDLSYAASSRRGKLREHGVSRRQYCEKPPLSNAFIKYSHIRAMQTVSPVILKIEGKVPDMSIQHELLKYSSHT
jgi:hypothetical protein